MTQGSPCSPCHLPVCPLCSALGVHGGARRDHQASDALPDPLALTASRREGPRPRFVKGIKGQIRRERHPRRRNTVSVTRHSQTLSPSYPSRCAVLCATGCTVVPSKVRCCSCLRARTTTMSRPSPTLAPGMTRSITAARATTATWARTHVPPLSLVTNSIDGGVRWSAQSSPVAPSRLIGPGDSFSTIRKAA